MQAIVKRTGTIANYSVTRAEASFVFNDADKTRLGAIAIAAGLAGLGGQAIATASYAASTEEHADYVEFDLDGLSVKGWVWRSPFHDGDQVEVVGEINGSHLEVAAIARPADRTIALYPHCSRGRTRHILNAAKWWFIGVSFFVFLVVGTGVLMTSRELSWEFFSPFVYLSIGCYAFFGLMTISLTRRWMPFVRVSEKVFRAFEWPNPGNVDLVKSSKAQRLADDPDEFGTFYFRY